MWFFEYMFGPRLYMDYEKYSADSHEMYKLPKSERVGDYIISTIMLLWEIGFYISPIIAAFLYRRGNGIGDSIWNWLKLSVSIVAITCLGVGLRAYGRLRSDAYRRLVQALKLAKSQQTAEQGREALTMFDFDFRWWPTDFDVRKIASSDRGAPNKTVLRPIEEKFRVLRTPQYVIGYILMHSFGIRMIYPGSIKALQAYLRPNLVAGRAKLILSRGAKRFKLITVDGNKIDTAFVDNRKRGKNGEVLIISSEGNLSFYEIGVGSTPVGREFSILGWNHPGFGGSTGKPYPQQEMNAIDAVITFAIRELHFDLGNIMLYGWSIGGFSTSCGASKYNGLKGIILDGTFDDIVELAILRFPHLFARLVELSVRDHCNLNNVELLKGYHGPVLIVRRTYDETIALDNRLETNRGNFLALKLLKHRFPNIFEPPQIELMHKILSKPLTADLNTKDEETALNKQLADYAKKNGKQFPMLIGENYDEEQRNCMAKFLLRKYVRDFRSSHCPRLPLEFFQITWDIPVK